MLARLGCNGGMRLAETITSDSLRTNTASASAHCIFLAQTRVRTSAYETRGALH